MRVPSLHALVAGLILLTFYTDLNADDPKGDFSVILRCVDELILGKWERATQIEGSEDTIEFTKDGKIACVEKRCERVRGCKGTYEITDNEKTIEMRVEIDGEKITVKAKIVKITMDEFTLRIANREEKLKKVK